MIRNIIHIGQVIVGLGVVIALIGGGATGGQRHPTGPPSLHPPVVLATFLDESSDRSEVQHTLQMAQADPIDNGTPAPGDQADPIDNRTPAPGDQADPIDARAQGNPG